MHRFHGLVPILGLVAVWLWLGAPAASQAPAARDTGLMGIVKSSDGKPMEGVAVSAKVQGKTITTSVWTNQKGQYDFPPLEDGQYRIWAQAVGFEMDRAERGVSSGTAVSQDFTLKPVQDFLPQLSDAEWMESLPDATPDDRRMKMILLNNCSTCHQPAWVLNRRLDADGWTIVVNHMGKISGWQDPPEKPGGGKYPDQVLNDQGKPMGAEERLWAFYKKDLIEYLTRVSGPKPFPLKPKPFPRPKGEAAQIVVTEYDVPNNRGVMSKLDTKTGRATMFTMGNDGETMREEVPPPNNEYRSGSDWFLGTRSDEQEGSAIHDIALGTDGNIYYSSPGMAADRRGYVFTGGGDLFRLDIGAQKLRRYPMPKGLARFHNGKAVDSTGNVWGSQQNGAHRINPETGEWTEFKALTPYGRPYDLTIDREDKVWFAQIAVDKIAVVNGRTGETGELVLTPYEAREIRTEDIDIGQRSGAWTMNAPLYQKGPRRMGADPNGDFVWLGLYWIGQLAKIDIRTKKIVAEYPIPEARYGHPYKIVVDKDHMVWFGMANEDRLGKFNPFTEAFTMYPLPTRGTNARHLAVDNSTDPPTIWVPYTSTQKIAKVQIRKASVQTAQAAPFNGATATLDDAQKRGEALFLKHCPLCHTFSNQKKELGIQSPTQLLGLFKNTTITEAAVRQIVTGGVPGKMPSFQYAMAPKEVDDLVAYLKVR